MSSKSKSQVHTPKIEISNDNTPTKNYRRQSSKKSTLKSLSNYKKNKIQFKQEKEKTVKSTKSKDSVKMEEVKVLVKEQLKQLNDKIQSLGIDVRSF